MTIYTRLGAPVQIVEAELRRRWWVMKPGRSEVFDTKPTERQLKGAKEMDEFDMWWIKAKQIGTYPHGHWRRRNWQMASRARGYH